MKVKSNKTSSAYSVGLGVVFMVSSILLSLMMLSYSPNDPSFNNASSSVPINFLGIPGAYISDLLLQIPLLTSSPSNNPYFVISPSTMYGSQRFTAY